MPVKCTCRRLSFSHTTLWNLPRIAWAALPKIGAYTVRYALDRGVKVFNASSFNVKDLP